MQGIISADKKSSTPPIMSSMSSPNRGSGSSVGFDASSPRDGDAVEELDSLAHAADGLIRLREHSEDEVGHLQRSPEIVRFPQESLHNFRFSSTSTNLTDLVELRKSLMNRSLNFLKNDDIRPGRSPDTLPAHCTPFSLMVGDDLGRTKTKSVGHSPVAYFSVENYRASRRRQQSHPMPDIQETRHSPETNKTSRPATPLTPDDSEVLATIPERRTPSRTSTTSSSSCTTSYSNVATSSDDDKSNKLDVLTCKGRRRLSSNMIFPHPALHNPSRFLPQNQAILTTYNDWRIILSNDVAALVLAGSGGSCRGLVGKSVVDFIDPTYRSRFLDMVMKRKEELNHLEDNTGGMVLICGNVLPIVKQDGTRSAASLWLKEKRNNAGSAVYIWIFEEVFETVVHVSVDMEGIIHYVDDSVHDLYGYDVDELIHKPVDILIPSLSRNNSTSNKQNMWTEINKLRSFGSKTKLGAYFPIVAKVHTVSNSSETTEPAPHLTLRITSIPMIAGLVTIRRDGSIEGCNAVFARYMFGFSQEELVQQHKNIADLMPQFPTLLRCLQRDDLLQHGIIINNHICRKLIADMDDTENKIPSVKNPQRRRLTQAPNGQTLPVLIAIHRDGTPFEVQLQLKLVEGSDDVCALWITFDRDATFSRVGHVPAASPPIEIKQHDGLGLPTAKKPLAPSENKKADPAPAAAKQLIQKQQNPDETENEPMRIITSFSRPNVVSHNPQSPVAPPTPTARENSSSSSKESSSQSFPEYSAQTNATTIDDYEILDNLGQGAYGLVKLAVRKDDPERKKVVIKYVIKSKILVDCWTKDRKLGVIPVEIHILHTLRRLPHENCSDMLDYFEDDDYYYIVMGLHGVGMDLFDYIELKNGMMDDEIRHIFKQIALAVRHLHDNKIVHRDIKDENVVLDENGGVRLIDFGSAAYLKGRRYDTFVGTLDYAAPEILAGQTYEGPPQDIWALGILLYTLVYRENPFYDIDEILGHELRVPFVLSEGSLDLIRKMLDRNVESRPNIHEVLAHPWLN